MRPETDWPPAMIWKSESGSFKAVTRFVEGAGSAKAGKTGSVNSMRRELVSKKTRATCGGDSSGACRSGWPQAS